MGFQVAGSILGRVVLSVGQDFECTRRPEPYPIVAGHHPMKRVHLLGTNDISFHDLAQVNTVSPTLPSIVDKWGFLQESALWAGAKLNQSQATPY